ncbi:MAG: hypothetical protein F6J87_08225 [Spirulina sp. SIO3F2]|nr:hypothetical protein [Spirulina sp. SIO3F2]
MEYKETDCFKETFSELRKKLRSPKGKDRAGKAFAVLRNKLKEDHRYTSDKLETRKATDGNILYIFTIHVAYRVVGVIKRDSSKTIVWFWAGSHSDYKEGLDKPCRPWSS